MPTSMNAQPRKASHFVAPLLINAFVDLQFYLAYRSLCPNAWVQRWNDQREAGNFPVDLEH